MVPVFNHVVRYEGSSLVLARKEKTMAIAQLVTPASMTKKQYDESVRRLKERGWFPAPGNISHVCFGDEPNLRVFDLWESEEAINAFFQQLGPILAEIGIQLGTQEMYEVHDYFK
jgi:hypothetical protein